MSSCFGHFVKYKFSQTRMLMKNEEKANQTTIYFLKKGEDLPKR
jgi:hypothetical protein